jgi:hypothetical protein
VRSVNGNETRTKYGTGSGAGANRLASKDDEIRRLRGERVGRIHTARIPETARFRERLRIRSCCLTGTDSATRERKPPGRWAASVDTR